MRSASSLPLVFACHFLLVTIQYIFRVCGHLSGDLHRHEEAGDFGDMIKSTISLSPYYLSLSSLFLERDQFEKRENKTKLKKKSSKNNRI